MSDVKALKAWRCLTSPSSRRWPESLILVGRQVPDLVAFISFLGMFLFELSHYNLDWRISTTKKLLALDTGCTSSNVHHLHR